MRLIVFRDARIVKGLPQPSQRLFDHCTALPLALDAEIALVSGVAQYLQTLADIIGVDAVAECAMADRDATATSRFNEARIFIDVLSCPKATHCRVGLIKCGEL